MPYILNKTNGSVIATVADGSINQTTDLTFVGKNYSGYGEIINENLLKLLENFSNSTPPPKVIMGQLYYNSTEKKLRVWDGTDFRTFPHVIYDTAFPVKSLNNGDLFFHSSQQKLYIRNSGSSSGYTLIGPSASASSGSSSGSSIISTSITDTTTNPHPAYIHTLNPTLEDPTPTLVVSEDPIYRVNVSDPINISEFNRKFDYIRPGINLPNVINGISTGATPYYFHGTATDSQKLNGQDASAYLLKDYFDSATNTTNGFNVPSDDGVLVGVNSVFKFHADSGQEEGKITATAGTKISFNLRYPSVSGNITNILTINGTQILPGPTVDVDLGSTDVGSRYRTIYTKTLNATTVTATSLTGTLTGIVIGNVTGNLTGNVTGNLTGNTTGLHTGNVTTQVITAGSDTTNGSITGRWALTGSSTLQATYADLAERYEADAAYEFGTVLMHGGEKEVTIATFAATTAVAGIVSKNPAYMMNSDAGTDETHPYIALKGRVPCKIVGPVKKGDLLVASGYKAGYAVKKQAHDSSDAVIGKALENFEGSFGVIEVKV
jgi:hypothetical protein